MQNYRRPPAQATEVMTLPERLETILPRQSNAVVAVTFTASCRGSIQVKKDSVVKNKLKVWGSDTDFDRQRYSRMIVAANTKTKAMKLLGKTRYGFETYWGVATDEGELMTATEEGIWVRPYRMKKHTAETDEYVPFFQMVLDDFPANPPDDRLQHEPNARYQKLAKAFGTHPKPDPVARKKILIIDIERRHEQHSDTFEILDRAHRTGFRKGQPSQPSR